MKPPENLPNDSDYTEYNNYLGISDNKSFVETLTNEMNRNQYEHPNPFADYTCNVQTISENELSEILKYAGYFDTKLHGTITNDTSKVYVLNTSTANLKTLFKAGDTVYWLERWNNYGHNYGSDNVMFVMKKTTDNNWIVCLLWGTHA